MKLFDFIFCDDIRWEANNKLSVMGMYNDRIAVKTKPDQKVPWPLPIRLSVVLRFQLEPNESRPTNFSYEYLINSTSIGLVKGKIEFNIDSSMFSLTIVGDGVPIQEGHVGFRVSLENDDKVLQQFVEPKALRVMTETT